MPQAKGIRVTLLVEDEAIEGFARRVLVHLGFGRRELYVKRAPDARNAKQWIERHYADEVRVYRGKAVYQHVGLLVGTDADQQTVVQRRGVLDHCLAAAAMAARGNSERLVLWIPKWSIETWILALTGEAVDEATRYKRDPRSMKIPEGAEQFVAEFRGPRERRAATTLPSLAVAYEETTRLA